MRNLKKMLSLVMALAMVASFMVVGASAAEFTDKDKIVNSEAVNTLVELNVISGRDTGAFDPAGVVTRAEMAKMISVILNGGKELNLGAAPNPSFKDTTSHWASGYIEFCANLKIVAGYGDGNFKPDATVTGSEAAKMLLAAAGYQATVEGFTGPNWSVSTDAQANVVGLYKDLSINTSAGLTRDNAAQMVYNALNIKIVTYKYSMAPDGTGGVITIPERAFSDAAGNKDITVLESKFNAVKVEGVVVANEWANLSATSDKGAALDAGKTKINITNGEDQTSFTGTLTFSTTTGLDLLGRSVVLYVRTNSNSAKAEVLGSVTVSADNKEYKDSSSDSISTVADDKSVSITSATLVAQNYGSTVNHKNFTDPKTAGVEKVLIDNDNDGDVEYVLMNTYNFGKVTSYSTSGDGSITVSAGTVAFSSKKADTQGFEDVAKNDYVLAAYIGGKLVVEKAESITGALEAYKGTNPTTKLTVDGTTYNVSTVAGYTGGSDNILAAQSYGSANLDNQATFYLDKNGYAAAVGDVSENAYNYALLMDEGTGLDNRVKVALPDGSTGIYTLNDSGNGFGLNDVTPGNVYAYSLNSNKQIKLTAAAQDFTSGNTKDAVFTKGKTTITSTGIGTGGTATAYANQNTVFFYTSTPINGSADVSVYTGYNKAPTLASSVATATVYKNGTRTVAVVFSGTGLTSANVSDNLYISSVGTSTSDYTNATAFIAGSSEAQSIKVDGANNASKGIYTYTINSDGYYELKSVPGGNEKTSTTTTQWGTYSANNNTIVIGTGANFANGKIELGITNNTLLVDHSDYLDDPIAEVGAGPDEGDKIAYVIYDLDNGKENNALLIVVKNDKTSASLPQSSDVEVINSDKVNSYASPTFYVGDGRTLTTSEMQDALYLAMTADGCTKITFDSANSGAMDYTNAAGRNIKGQAVVLTQVYKINLASNAANAGANGGVFSMTTDAVNGYAKSGATVEIKVKVETAATGTGATVTLGGATTAPATLAFASTDAVNTTKAATFTMGTADVTLTMAAANT